MKHSDILKIVEKNISTDSISLLDIKNVSIHRIEDDEYEVVPGELLSTGLYGVVELRVIVPIT